MGKGIITGNLGDGLYQVKLVLDQLRAVYNKNNSNAKKEEYTNILNKLEDDLAVARSELLAELEKENPKPQKYRIKIYQIESKISAATALRLSCIKKIEYINRFLEPPVVEAWCADKSLNLPNNSLVATTEVPGERGRVQIRPAYDGGAVYNAGRDGILQPAISSELYNFFYNLSILPGWQKWRPQYRYGVVTNINNDRISVSVDVATSSQQNLNVNQSGNLEAIACKYLTCDCGAFEVGDHVLIEFPSRRWAQNPRVIGFYDHPLGCPQQAMLLVHAHDAELLNFTYVPATGRFEIGEDIAYDDSATGPIKKVFLDKIIGDFSVSVPESALITGINSDAQGNVTGRFKRHYQHVYELSEIINGQEQELEPEEKEVLEGTVISGVEFSPFSDVDFSDILSTKADIQSKTLGAFTIYSAVDGDVTNFFRQTWSLSATYYGKQCKIGAGNTWGFFNRYLLVDLQFKEMYRGFDIWEEEEEVFLSVCAGSMLNNPSKFYLFKFDKVTESFEKILEEATAAGTSANVPTSEYEMFGVGKMRVWWVPLGHGEYLIEDHDSGQTTVITLKNSYESIGQIRGAVFNPLERKLEFVYEPGHYVTNIDGYTTYQHVEAYYEIGWPYFCSCDYDPNTMQRQGCSGDPHCAGTLPSVMGYTTKNVEWGGVILPLRVPVKITDPVAAVAGRHRTKSVNYDSGLKTILGTVILGNTSSPGVNLGAFSRYARTTVKLWENGVTSGWIDPHMECVDLNYLLFKHQQIQFTADSLKFAARYSTCEHEEVYACDLTGTATQRHCLPKCKTKHPTQDRDCWQMNHQWCSEKLWVESTKGDASVIDSGKYRALLLEYNDDKISTPNAVIYYDGKVRGITAGDIDNAERAFFQLKKFRL